jgi:hypothetical protein
VLLSATANSLLAEPITGTSVGGSLDFAAHLINYFDPGNGFVPNGYLNTAGSTVNISEAAMEFGFADETAEISANFTGTQLIITDYLFGENSYNAYQLRFTNAAVTSLAMVSDGFPGGGLTGSLADGVITLDWAGGVFNSGGMFQAVFAVTLPPPPPLSIQLTTSNSVVVSWPAPSLGYVLHEKQELGSTNWTQVTTAPDVTNGVNQVTVSAPAGARFYRLKLQL